MAETQRVSLGRGLRAHLQPIVALEDGAIVGYESLIRGPQGSDHESPDRLFAAARNAGCLAELDVACMQAAFGAARVADL
jgi:EAL domain-containing protein (putative c-di-GMP-specific phosphodiesterase class I)